jgi:DNA-3-methyladenine glycosylase
MCSIKYNKLPRSFYERDPLLVTEKLLGKILVKKSKHDDIAGEIVETEAYIGPYDKASHSYNYRKTRRTLVQFGERGCAYIFSIYGMYHCFCIVVGPPYMPAVALIRAVKPIHGIELMKKNRGLKENVPVHKLANGPSRVCKAFDITSKLNGTDLLGENLFLCEGVRTAFEIGRSARIGIDYAEEFKDVPWRFYIKGDQCVSKART